MKNMLQHGLYLFKKFQIARIKFETVVQKIVKNFNFKKRCAYDFVGNCQKKRIKHPAKFEKQAEFRVTSKGHSTFSFNGRKKLKVSADTSECEEKM